MFENIIFGYSLSTCIYQSILYINLMGNFQITITCVGQLIYLKNLSWYFGVDSQNPPLRFRQSNDRRFWAEFGLNDKLNKLY